MGKGTAETAVHLRISGRVQNVWYRGWLAEQANCAGIRGWVRNRSDSTVEALLIGPESLVQDVAGRCRAGPRAAVVVKVRATPGRDDGSAGFRLRPTV